MLLKIAMSLNPRHLMVCLQNHFSAFLHEWSDGSGVIPRLTSHVIPVTGNTWGNNRVSLKTAKKWKDIGKLGVKFSFSFFFSFDKAEINKRFVSLYHPVKWIVSRLEQLHQRFMKLQSCYSAFQSASNSVSAFFDMLKKEKFCIKEAKFLRTSVLQRFPPKKCFWTDVKKNKTYIKKYISHIPHPWIKINNG